MRVRDRVRVRVRQAGILPAMSLSISAMCSSADSTWEIWGDIGRYREIQGDIGRDRVAMCSSADSTSAGPSAAGWSTSSGGASGGSCCESAAREASTIAAPAPGRLGEMR